MCPYDDFFNKSLIIFLFFNIVFILIYFERFKYFLIFKNLIYLEKFLNIFIGVISTLKVKKNNFFLYFFSTFIMILNFNLMSIYPYSFAVTSHINFTFFIALSFFFGLLLIALNFKNIFFFSLFYPSGSPLIVTFILIPIEFLSFFMRVFSLSIRLFANIMAGHLLMKVLAKFSWSFLININYFILFYFLSILIIFVFILEICIAIVQAYIFIVLQITYFSEIFN